MKSMKQTLLLALALATWGTTPTQASQEQLAVSMAEARTEATKAGDQLKSTLEALTALVKQPKGDLRPAYDAFAAQIPKTESAEAWTRLRLQWMDGDGKKYFANWQKTIDGIANEGLRKKAQKRLDAVQKSFDKVKVSLQSASQKFTPFLSDLKDIQKVLAADVTAAGVKAIKGTVSSANWNHKAVSGAMTAALKEMLLMEKSLSSEAK